MAADLILAWAHDFALLMGRLALDVLLVLIPVSLAVVVAIGVVCGLGGLREKGSSEEAAWASFVAGHPLDDLITVTEVPDA